MIAGTWGSCSLPTQLMRKLFMFSVCQKNLCVLLKPVCPELLTINTWQPVLQMTSPFVNEQGMADEALSCENPYLAGVSWTPRRGCLGKKSVFSPSCSFTCGQPISIVVVVLLLLACFIWVNELCFCHPQSATAPG